MAQRLIELSCARLRQDISDEDDELIRATSLDEVRAAIRQIETLLASRQSLRNLDRLTPYLNAVERYSKAVGPLFNDAPCLPYIWAPVKIILSAVCEHTQALDKILSAYAQIGNSLPYLSRLGDTFPQDRDFQQLFAFLFEDIIEFHRKAYALIRKPAWKIFFCSAWGRFEYRFGGLIESITRVSALIDREAASLDIYHANEWRKKALDDSINQEQRWESEQVQALLKWLECDDNDQELKFEWLKERCCPGTGRWIIGNAKFRSWLQSGAGNPVMWLYGKPGAGKSVLASQIISFLRLKSDTRVLFFFCDYHSAPYKITARIIGAFIAQIMRIAPGTISFFYDELLAKRQTPSAPVLKEALTKILAEFNDVCLLVDGIDELPESEHKAIISHLIQLTKASNSSCKLLVLSQDRPSIRPHISQKRTQNSMLFLGDEKSAIEKDVDIIVKNSLEDLNRNVGNAISPSLIEELQRKIRQKSEGMLLWVRLVLLLLGSSANLAELSSNVDSLPRGLEAVYEKILNNIQDRCLACSLSLARVRRIFGWLIFSKTRICIKKYEVLIGMSLHEGSDKLGRHNRPFSTALEICKPLIEDGPGGTVAIIHPTVEQYLRSELSGPFISSFTAHGDITFACISQLIQVLDYVDDDISHQDLMTRTGLGLFGLQSYANENWIYHLLRIFECDAPSSSIAQGAVVMQALRLCAKHNRLMRSRDTKPLIYFQEESSIDLKYSLNNLESTPEIRLLIRQVLSFRSLLEDQQTKNGLDADALELDKTLFSRADASYQRDVQHLSQLGRYHSYQGLTQDELLAFRSDYGLTAFTCPIRSCDRFRVGYGSLAKLEDHKETRHSKALKCYLEGCAYNDVGYASAKHLREHQRKHHGKRDSRRVPTVIRRSARNDQRNTRQQTGHQIQQPGPLQAPSPNDPKPTNIDEIDNVALGDLEVDAVASNQKRIGSDWYAIFNPAVERVLDVDLVHSFTHDSVICCVKFSHDGKYIATGCSRSTQIFNVRTGEKVCVLEDHDTENTTGDMYIRSICFSPDGHYLATGGEDHLIRVWHIETRTIRNQFSGHCEEVYSLDFAHDGRTIVSGSSDRTVRLWDIEQGTNTLTVTIDDTVTAVAISPDTEYFTAASLNNSVYVWHIETGHLVERLESPDGHNDSVYSVAFSPNGKDLVTGSLDRTIKIWELSSPRNRQAPRGGKCVKTLKGHKDFVLSVAFTPDAYWVLSGSKDRGVQFWDLRTGKAQLMLQGHKNSVISVASSPQGYYFATASGDMKARIWSYRSY